MKKLVEHPAGISRRGTRSLSTAPMQQRSRTARRIALALSVAAAASLSACSSQEASDWRESTLGPGESGSATVAASATDSARTPVHVDSILPIPVLLERYRADIPQVDTLSFASASREALVKRFADALAAGDSTELRAMAMTAAEFAWLYYPASEFTSPPYELAPEHVHMLIDQNSQKGFIRMIRRSVGASMEYAGHDCPDEPRIREHNRFWERCNVHLRNPDGSVDSLRLFGGIWELDGSWKLVSFANEL